MSEQQDRTHRYVVSVDDGCLYGRWECLVKGNEQRPCRITIGNGDPTPDPAFADECWVEQWAGDSALEESLSVGQGSVVIDFDIVWSDQYPSAINAAWAWVPDE